MTSNRDLTSQEICKRQDGGYASNIDRSVAFVNSTQPRGANDYGFGA
jgi:hypothetical protein